MQTITIPHSRKSKHLQDFVKPTTSRKTLKSKRILADLSVSMVCVAAIATAGFATLEILLA